MRVHIHPQSSIYICSHGKANSVSICHFQNFLICIFDVNVFPFQFDIGSPHFSDPLCTYNKPKAAPQAQGLVHALGL